ncbi:fused acetyl/propionyl-CoA carboxylase subuit alpha/methylmalonyl-CoA decarboxylase subunit alpha [Tessaracoccus lapidicaptus]|uniref:Fused acetyl/propionyl-CoA carboxylase subuit alpha/methylmalonyl-CoA decarboxylase subunit alpha n=1 Tax=Tessaracoccus lapidicaptus TaxID=1427523 RepID=A0A1C0AL94_9ACTN|nr:MULTISPECIES: carboxyl transferase domain-containing protein [Tessaracoccus]AQX15994.1 fused acetyl/propionyl-CoA carboxylase subuit alpha/methylmalonyl-CoA decarboxylase subunit alpha [Tessaracoccus sp. T2.5-30]OCL33295.1 fused acetyl/propionyl-CoA carboxylase subuit alpha/methylmalonyl-CoA decarboxylase subunit alpha [Tessaracoccus lapidicaptus]VEP40500.1 Biotin carboxylase [Tessaracoccus lapidicaptus]
MFRRIAIVNRGEAAMRLIHAVRDLNAEHPDRDPIATIALYTDAERSAMFAREADEAYPLGPAAERPYLNHELLARVLTEARADAVWVGWGFVAEDAAFADLVESLGITFIGPSGDAMRKLGDKIGSKLIAEEVGVPVAPWSRGGVDTLDEALEAAERVGYPLMLKATAGGGGRGIRKVTSADELADAYQRTRDEAERAFGSGVVFLEKLVTGARHVEVQVIADSHGNAWAIGVRDCTVQRRNQKIIEESASPLLAPEQTDELKAAAERLALAVGYRGAGTVEFLYHPGEKMFAFLEVNTRLQVEHPITEVTNDFDLVKAQIHVAAGGALEERPTEFGHAVEARLNAEDPDRDFAPAPGLIARLDLPAGPGIRVDTGVAEGDSIPADFDSMIAKIIAHGRTRDEALGRLRRAMAETTVVIEGGATNKSFILELLQQPEVVGPRLQGDAPRRAAAGAVDEPFEWADTGWIDRTRAEGGLIADEHAGVALVIAAIEAYEETTAIETDRLLTTAHGGRPQTQHKSGLLVDLKLRGAVHTVTAFATAPGRYRVVVDGTSTEAELHRLDEVHGRAVVGGRRHRIISATHGPIHLIEVDGVTHRVSRDEGGVLRSPAPALVVATPVAVGDEVEAGAPVIVLESMKMETAIHAPFAGRVKELLVMTGSQVESMAPLVRLEPLGNGGDASAAADVPAVEIPTCPPVADPAERAARLLSDLSATLMGFDVDPSAKTLPSYLEARDEARAAGADVLSGEIGLVTLFADLAELSRNRPFGEQANTELRVHSDREHFHRYLTTLDVDRAGLPTQFVDRLAAALRHYGVESLDRTPALEAAVFRIFLAQKRVASDVPLILGLLDRWISEPAPDADRAVNARAQLERLVRATQLRFPAVGDLARSVRFRWFDQPQVDAERAAIVAGVGDEVEALAAAPDAADYDERIARLAAIPEWTANFLATRLGRGVPAHEPMLEVLLRKYYTDYDLSGVQRLTVGGRSVVLGDYMLGERPRRFVGTVGLAEEMAAGGPLESLVASQVAARTPGYDAVVELYVLWPERPDPEALGTELLARLRSWSWDDAVTRVAVGVCTADGAVEYRTFRFPHGEIVEDEKIRGLPPMVGRRLDLWRLRDFDITRLDAPADVLLFDCVAKANPDDRRLVAMAQVRQLAVVRDADGRLIGLPHAERSVANCLEAIRRTRSARGKAGSKLDMNHVWVHVWPEIDLDIDDITPLQDRITPLSDGAGIEEVLCQGRFVRPPFRDDAPDAGERREGSATGRHTIPLAVRFHAQPGAGVTTTVTPPPTEPLKPLDDYAGKVVRARRRGLVYPYELSATLAGPGGSLAELDLDDSGRLVEVDRAPGRNKAGIIVAKVTTPTALHPEGVTRIVLSGDPTKGLGAVAEPECSRIMAALDLAEETGVPVEWFTLSSGARISMESGTENMDWVGAALRRIVEFTQAGGEINVVVAGINVGAQPYWNAEATMLMHTKGILVMTPDSAMVLTGKQSLDFSGGVSAEDNFGIGGYDRVMGPNGQAQYWAKDLGAAMGILMSHYDHTYVAPGETAPRRAVTGDPVDRDVSDYPHNLGTDFATVGQIFSREHNPDRKKPFDIRTVIAAVCDQDHPRVERWAGMAEAETAVVVDARIGGHSVSVVGIESMPVSRAGFPPADGPDTFTGGTLFPRSSKKVARAINAASGNRPLVVLANLSGFDGSPESMRNLQLEYGAEIGRAIVNFDGPIVFVVISRYHGGAFVVFSKRLNENMTVLAIEGSFASVIGGAPAAAVVFAGDVAKRTAADPRVAELEAALRDAAPEQRAELQVELADVRAAVRAEKISEIAAEFDGVHNIHRAVAVGSVDRVIAPAELRPSIVEVIEAHAR